MKSIFLLFTFIGFGANAQYDGMTSMFWNSYSHFNPATTGLEYKHDFRTSYRYQRQNYSYPDPRYLIANYNTRIGKHHGVGINYNYNYRFYGQYNVIHLNYNYQFELKQNRRISIGISPGIENYKADLTVINPYPNPFKYYIRNFNLNTGVAYQGEKIYGGIGVTHAVNSVMSSSIPDVTNYSTPNYYAHFRYKLQASRHLHFLFETFIRTDLVKAEMNVNARACFKDQYWFGVAYRTDDSFILNAGWDIRKRYRIGYSIDLRMISSLNPYIARTHEFTLGYLFPFQKPSVKLQ